MASYVKRKNLLSTRDVYNRYYGDFRGVDFSSDHTQVNESRLAYSVNMYKDYRAGQGQALETVPGFRRRVKLPNEDEVFGIHHFQHKRSDGQVLTKILIHAGTNLYLWLNYPNSINVVLPAETSETDGTRTFKLTLGDNVEDVIDITTSDGESVLSNTDYNQSTHELSVSSSVLSEGDNLCLSFVEGLISEKDVLFGGMNEHRSTSFIFNNLLYLIDGKNYLVYNGEKVTSVSDNSYIPTTYINIIPGGENRNAGKQNEHRNLLQPKFKHTFVADGSTNEFYMNEDKLDSITEVKVYGEPLTEEGYTISTEDGKITFTTPPGKPEDNGYPEGHAGVEITATKARDHTKVTNCTLATVFDDRVFFSGNPDEPNNLYWCNLNDPSYFPEPFFVPDGVGIAPITGMLVVADTLMVLKSDTQQDGSVYFHTPTETGDNLYPKLYNSTRGLAGIGCLGACINFLDDPVFISRLGVEAVGQLSTRLERAIEHRSSLVDAKLVNMDLTKASIEEWNGYLVVLVDGKIFLADSRQRYTHETGTMQYEWYYLEDIGVYHDQYLEYRYTDRFYDELAEKVVHYCPSCKRSKENCTCGKDFIDIPIELAPEELRGTVVNEPDTDGESVREVFYETVNIDAGETSYPVGVYYTVHEVGGKYKAYLCESKGNYIGGTFKKATYVKCLDNNLFFGTENGVVCSFNFDKRNELGEIPTSYYSFDGRTIFCGCATRMDCCGVPHLTKNTVKKSTVIKTKTFASSAAKIKVRTNKKPYEQIARINSTIFTFDNVDFSDLTFITTEQSLFAVKEKEKQWVEKQYFVYSDEYQKPFALYYISFRYNIAGRYKE